MTLHTTSGHIADALALREIWEALDGPSWRIKWEFNCDVECIQLLNLDSTNMRPEHWLDMVRCIRENYDRYDGFVITHGTDTMAYTAAGLSYLIQGAVSPTRAAMVARWRSSSVWA